MNMAEAKESLASRMPVILKLPGLGETKYKYISRIIFRNVLGNIESSAECISEATGEVHLINDISLLKLGANLPTETTFPSYIRIKRKSGMSTEEASEALMNKKPVILTQIDGSTLKFKRVSALIYSNNRGAINVSVELEDVVGNSFIVADTSWVSYQKER